MKCVVTAGVLLAIAARTGGAQSRFSLDVSGGATRHQFAEPGTALSIAPRFFWKGDGAGFDAGFTYTRGASMQWNAEGGARGALFRRLGENALVSVGASGWWTAHRIGEGTGQFSLTPSLNLRNVLGSEVLLEAGAGHAATLNGGRWFGMLGARGHVTVGPFDVIGQLHHTRFSQRALRWGSEWGPGGGTDTMTTPDTLNTLRNYSDVGVSIAWMLAGARLQLTLEQRLGHPEFRATGWHIEGSLPMAAHLAVFASGGETLSALTAGLPARRYSALGIRWSPGRSGFRSPRPVTTGRAVRIERLPDATSRIALYAGTATTVEIMGDFSDWEASPLVSLGGGWWALQARLAPGVYRMNLRADGGVWRVPPGLPAEQDDFGGRVGVLLVR